jgi:heme-degrading monooxygenase HmoA
VAAPATLPGMAPQSITVFRSRLRADAPGDYLTLADELEVRARTFPGFVEFKKFTAADGERLALVTFASADAEAAWRDDERHRNAQQRGRDEFYEEYDVAVCSVDRRHRWEPSGA